MADVIIVGNGVVGQNLRKEYARLDPAVYDKYKSPVATLVNLHHTYDIAFICVPTPFVSADNPCDISEVVAALREVKATVYVIKSTILPGTTEMLAKQYSKPIVFSPEFYGETLHNNNFEFNFTILGGPRNLCDYVISVIMDCYDARHHFKITDSKTAELTKYMENSWLATKVGFCTQFWRLAQNLGIDYNELRECFLLDPRVNPSHTFVYPAHPYWTSHCLDKDVPALVLAFENTEYLKGVIEFNTIMKENYENRD